MYLGTVCSIEGRLGDGTPFRGITAEQIAQKLHGLGYPKTGKQTVYNGMTGEKIKNSMFIGSIFYQRLKHQVKDKWAARARGPITNVTRHKTDEGRKKGGGLRFGEYGT